MTAQAPVLPDTDAASSGWEASLALTLARRGERSVLAGVVHEGPLRLQRAFYPEGPACPHLYLLHPPGGMVPGDVLRIDGSVGPGATALITTPASAKVYDAGSRALEQRQCVEVRLGAGSTLEWLPQDTIVFNGARYRASTVFRLAADARLFAWDVVTLGRAVGNQPFVRGDVLQRLEIWREDTPVLIERIALDAHSPLRDAGWGWQGCTVWGTCVATVMPPPALVDALREMAGTWGGCASVTVVRGCVVARWLGDDAGGALRWFQSVWTLIRPLLTGRPACRPRVWDT